MPHSFLSGAKSAEYQPASPGTPLCQVVCACNPTFEQKESRCAEDRSRGASKETTAHLPQEGSGGRVDLYEPGAVASHVVRLVHKEIKATHKWHQTDVGSFRERLCHLRPKASRSRFSHGAPASEYIVPVSPGRGPPHRSTKNKTNQQCSVLSACAETVLRQCV